MLPLFRGPGIIPVIQPVTEDSRQYKRTALAFVVLFIAIDCSTEDRVEEQSQ
jgi:hypothetical protein